MSLDCCCRALLCFYIACHTVSFCCQRFVRLASHIRGSKHAHDALQGMSVHRGGWSSDTPRPLCKPTVAHARAHLLPQCSQTASLLPARIRVSATALVPRKALAFRNCLCTRMYCSSVACTGPTQCIAARHRLLQNAVIRYRAPRGPRDQNIAHVLLHSICMLVLASMLE